MNNTILEKLIKRDLSIMPLIHEADFAVRIFKAPLAPDEWFVDARGATFEDMCAGIDTISDKTLSKIGTKYASSAPGCVPTFTVLKCSELTIDGKEMNVWEIKTNNE